MDLCQMLRRAAAIHASGVATIEGTTRRTWAEAADRIARLAAGLAGQGIAEGDRVALLGANSVAYWEMLFALFQLGAVAVPLNTRLTPSELAFQIADAGARMIVTDGAAGHGATRLHLGPDTEALIAAHDPYPGHPRGGAQLAAIYYTGGTTGLPKGVMLSHDNLRTMAQTLVMHLQVDQASVILHAAPMFHLADFAIFVATLVAGTHVVIPAFDDETMLTAIDAARVTHCFTVPLMIDRMARHPRRDSFDLSALRVLGYGGAPMPRGTYEHARATFPQIDFCQGFGMTEMPAHTFLDARAHREPADSPALRSAGKAGYPYEVEIRDRQGRPLPPGQVGEIVGRGGNVMLGYWNRPEETAQALRDGWMHSGDAGFLDADGHVTITDRFKDMIVSGGENVYSIEVENVISQFPGLAECAVIGQPDATWGERVHAVLVLAPGATFDAQAFEAHCRARLAGYKRPRSIDLRDRPLPRSAAGKVLKRDLRNQG